MTIPENNNSYTVPPYTPVYRHESSLAVASMICGILSWLPVIHFFGAIAAVITGHMAKKEIRESNGTLTGDGMALTGLILGYAQLGLLLIGLICIMTFLFAFSSDFNTSTLFGPSAALFFNLI
jgi:hypothetical protein